jgi:hypothetical protein
MKYVLLICDDESEVLGPDEIAAHPGHRAWSEEMVARGVFDGGNRLRPVADATSVRVRDGETLVSDGPFAETKEFVAGYAVIECADLDEALEVAAKHPVAASGTIEVRPVWEP